MKNEKKKTRPKENIKRIKVSREVGKKYVKIEINRSLIKYSIKERVVQSGGVGEPRNACKKLEMNKIFEAERRRGGKKGKRK